MLDITPSPRATLLTAGIFAGVALLLASPSFLPRAIADEQPAKSLLSSANDLFPQVIDTGRLTRWDFVAEPGVSTAVLHQSQVRKIAYGRTSFVNVVETASGVYSSDGLTDPHVQYPGIHRTPKEAAFSAFLLLNGGQWIAAAPFGAGSFVTIVPFEGGQLVTTDTGQCVVGASGVSC
jgi:hypothetical protein